MALVLVAVGAEIPIRRPSAGLSSVRIRRQDCAVALSFLYLAFVRLLQLLQLSRTGQEDLAIEVVMLRHEVAVAAALDRTPRLATGRSSGAGRIEPAPLEEAAVAAGAIRRLPRRRRSRSIETGRPEVAELLG